MNFVTKVMAVGGIAILGAVVGACENKVVSASGSQTRLYDVKLTTDGHSGVLKVNLGKYTKKCEKRAHDGCMLFEAGKIGQIKFYLPGSPFQLRKCSGTTPKAKNVITSIELAVEEKEGDADYDSDGSKGKFTGKLPDWIKYDAFQAVNLETGYVYDAPWDKAATQVYLENLNSHTTPGEKSFWYRVTVTSCEAGEDGVHEKWVSDPRADNEGLN